MNHCYYTQDPEARNNARRTKNSSGFVALVSLLVIGAFILVMSTSISVRSISETAMSSGGELAQRAHASANLCAEQALMKLENTLSYTGNETLTIDGVSCTINAISGSGNTSRTVTAHSTVSNYSRKVQVVVSQISPIMLITSWQEVSDF